MSTDRIKVAGYSQSVGYGDNIFYRDFSPDLVGFQLTSAGNTPLFTIGNFAVTTNLEPKKTKIFTTTKLSNFVTLTDLNLDLSQTIDLLKNNSGVFLNFDKTKLNNYSLFGSLREFTRVALETIIMNWPAALYMNSTYSLPPDFITKTGYTVDRYYYDLVTDTSTFRISTNVINNQYEINYLRGIDLNGNNPRDLKNNYESYCVYYDKIEYNLVGFTGASSENNSFIYLRVNGNPFNSIDKATFTYYIKPNKIKENLFYNSLDDYEAYLLNRQVFPKYTALFNFRVTSNNGGVLFTNESLTWPTTDGYNIDYDTDEYVEYANRLLEICDQYDNEFANLMVRFLVAESITDFDTTFVHLDPANEETADQKMNKTLTVYGVEYDKINLFINNIKFANTVTYNKLDNTPDVYLKNLARVLGWDLISSVLQNDLLGQYILPKESTYSGQSVGLTLVEADTELWRRIILNTPWLWKSKGARKSIEFLFKFIGTPLGLIQFNEYVYIAENNIDIAAFYDALELLNLRTDDDYVYSNYPIDFDGYPSPLRNSPGMYFQNDGLWYRETGGDNAAIDITTGNNPHSGPYDGGGKYINNFRKLLPSFSGTVLTSQTTTVFTSNLFTNYTLGTFTTYSGNTYVNITNQNSNAISNCYIADTTIIPDPRNRKDETDCGCPSPENLRSLSICVNKRNFTTPCVSDISSSKVITPEGYYMFSYYLYNIDGTLYKDINGANIYYESEFVDPFCCKQRSGTSYFYNKGTGLNSQQSPFVLESSGYICCTSTNTCGCLVTCKRRINPNKPTVIIGNSTYILFKNELGNEEVVSQDGCNCVGQTPKGILSRPVKINDPATGKNGFGCQLTIEGLSDLSDLNTSIIFKTYENRANGNISCSTIFNGRKKQKLRYVTIQFSQNIGSSVINNSYKGSGREFAPELIQRFATLPDANDIIIGTYTSFDNTNDANQYIDNNDKVTLITRGQTNLYSIWTRLAGFSNANDELLKKLGYKSEDIEKMGKGLVIPKLGYVISNRELTAQEFAEEYIRNYNKLETKQNVIQGTNVAYYYGEFDFQSVIGDEEYIYLIYDYVIPTEYLKYAEAVGLTDSASAP